MHQNNFVSQNTYLIINKSLKGNEKWLGHERPQTVCPD